MRTGLFRFIPLLFGMLASTAYVPTAEAEPTPEPAKASRASHTAEKQPAPIPVPDVAEAYLAFQRRLGAIDEILRPAENIVEVRNSFQLEKETLKQLTAEREAVPVERLPTSRIVPESHKWNDVEHKLARHHRTLEKRTQDLESVREELEATSIVWKRTKTNARAEDAPAAVLDQIQTVRQLLTTRTTSVTRTLGDLLTLGREVSEALVSINKMLKRFEAAERNIRNLRLVADRPPIWTLLARSHQHPLIDRQTIATPAQGIYEELGLFLVDNRTGTLMQASLFLLVLATIYILRLRGLDRLGRLAPSTLKVLAHPFASAALLALMPSRLFYPDIHERLVDSIALVGLIPTATLVIAVVESRTIRYATIGLAVLFILAKVQEFTLEGTFLQRLVLLASCVLGIVGLVLVRRDPSFKALARREWSIRLAIGLTPLAFLVFVVAFFANLFGYVSLCDLLVQAIVSSAYLGILVGATVEILSGLLQFILRLPLLHFFRSIRIKHALIARELYRWLRVAALAFWVRRCLGLFDVWDPIKEAFVAAFDYGFTAGTIRFRILDPILFVAALWASVIVSRVVCFFLDEEVLPRLPLARGVPNAISRSTGYVLLGFGVVVAFAVAGVGVSQLTVVFGALGLGVGLGLQNMVNNFVSGLILMFERPIQVGDTVDFGGVGGEVRSIGLRASIVRTWPGAEVIVPNGQLISKSVTNWTLSDRERRVDVLVRIPFEVDPVPARDLLLKLAAEHPKAATEPAPFVLVLGFGDKGTELELRFWIKDISDLMDVQSEIRLAIHRAFRESSIPFAIPRLELLSWTTLPKPDTDAALPEVAQRPRS
jgi:potassium-dependent mechanosensitive channel